MLVLSRRIGESLTFEDSMGEMVKAKITIVDVGRGKVRLGIEFPRRMIVTRSELRPSDDSKS